ncbi:MAG: polysaccharide deacetylase family protein, partial [Janthinobacterium sp.]
MTAALSILIYHRVLARSDPLFPGEVDAVLFERQLRLLKRFYTPMPLADAVQRLQDGSLPPRAACITFDDGYADNAQVALPLLRRHGMHATF